MTAVFIFLMLGILDIITPMLARAYGLNEFPQTSDAIRKFRRDVGYVKFPRTIFLFLGAAFLGLLEIPHAEYIGVVVGCAFLLAWMGALIWDIWRARQNWVNGDTL